MAEPLLDVTDGQRWAAEFIERFRGRVVGEDVDDYLLTCWFANAIETGRSAGYGAALNDGRIAGENDA